ncbi:MAG: DNA-3-methyladenine glycosylase [Anaerolineae bacterium]
MGVARREVPMADLTPFEQRLAEGAVYLHQADRLLAPIITRMGALRMRLHQDYFGSLVSAIISQQLSGKAAQTIEDRFRAVFADGRQFTPANVAAMPIEEMRAAGLSEAKSRYLRDLGERVANGDLDLNQLADMDDEEVVQRLVEVKGIGRWTAEMFLIFSLGRLDVLPVDDLGLRKAVMLLYGLNHMPKRPDLEDLAGPWQPYRTVATLYLWRTLSPQEGPAQAL